MTGEDILQSYWPLSNTTLSWIITFVNPNWFWLQQNLTLSHPFVSSCNFKSSFRHNDHQYNIPTQPHWQKFTITTHASFHPSPILNPHMSRRQEYCLPGLSFPCPWGTCPRGGSEGSSSPTQAVAAVPELRWCKTASPRRTCTHTQKHVTVINANVVIRNVAGR